MRTVTYNLQQFLIEAKRGAFVIPRFQREFIWKDAQVKLLTDSIARNYPIGSLLLLQEPKPTEPFLASRKLDALINEADADDDDPLVPAPTLPEMTTPSAVFYILDGQQRLTSLVRVFLQSSPTGHYYFDLKEMFINSNERASSNWVVARGQQRKLTNRYLRSDIVFEAEKCQIMVEEYFEQNEGSVKDDRSAQRRASAKVNRIFETIRNYQIPLVIIDQNESMEAICRIFETINSTGTRLTTFDLAVARFFPEPDLGQLWQGSLDKHEILKRFNTEGERVLQVIALLVGADAGKPYLEVTRAKLLELSKFELSAKWEKASQVLADAYEWAEDRGAVPSMLANENLLVALALFLALASDSWKQKNPGFARTLERWYFANALQQGAHQATNYRVAEVTGKLRAWIDEGKLPEIPMVSLTIEELLRLPKSDNRYRTIHSILRWKGKRDLWTGELLRPDDVEDHHIFPAAIVKREGHLSRKLLDSVANRLLISTRTNRALGDRMPRDYMEKLLREAKSNGTLQQTRDALRDACIPVPTDTDHDLFINQFDQSQVERFLRDRSRLLLDMLKNILGDALRQTPDTTWAEDDT